CCSNLIIIMAPLGWAGNLSQGYTGSARERWPKRGIFRKERALPTTMRAQAPTPIPRRPRCAFTNHRPLKYRTDFIAAWICTPDACRPLAAVEFPTGSLADPADVFGAARVGLLGKEHPCCNHEPGNVPTQPLAQAPGIVLTT